MCALLCASPATVYVLLLDFLKRRMKGRAILRFRDGLWRIGCPPFSLMWSLQCAPRYRISNFPSSTSMPSICRLTHDNNFANNPTQAT